MIRAAAAAAGALVLLAACAGPSAKADDARIAARATSAPPAPAVEGMTPGSVDSPCGAQGVIVTFSVESFAGVDAGDTSASLGRLRTLAGRATQPIRELVTRTDYSPAIRTVRLALRDSGAVRRAVADLAKVPDVSEVALDACALTIQKKAP